MRLVSLNLGDVNYPIVKRISANSESTKSDGLIPFGSTIASITAKAYNSRGVDCSTSLISASSLNGNLARIFLSGSTILNAGIYNLYLDLTYNVNLISVIDKHVQIAVVNLR